MTSLKVYNLQRAEVGSFEIKQALQEIPLKEHLVQEVITAHLAAARQGTHSTKGTSEVHGSTKKLYKQKGTGNARSGSRKAVQRRHGATQFGPKPRDYTKKINKKVSRFALGSVVAMLLREGKLHLIDQYTLPNPKSADFRAVINQWECDQSLWVDAADFETNFSLSARNFSKVKLSLISQVNVYDLVKFKNVFFTPAAMTQMTERLKI